MSKQSKLLLMWLFLVILVITGIHFNQPKAVTPEITSSQLEQSLKGANVSFKDSLDLIRTKL